MAQIGNVPEINEVKKQLDKLKEKGLINEWEIPYEDLLTRLSASVFFLTPASETQLAEIWRVLGAQRHLQYRENLEKKLSSLAWRVEFNGE